MSRPPGTSANERWLKVRRLLSWAAVVYARLALVAALLLVVILAVLGVFESGPAGIALLAIAAMIVLAYIGHRLRPFVWSVARKVKPRFALRTLLIGTLVTGAALAWIGNRVRDIRQQRQILNRVFDRGFIVGFDDEMPGWMYHRFGWNGVLAWGRVGVVAKDHRIGLPVSDEDLHSLAGLRYQELSLNRSNLNDQQIRRWKPPAELKCFSAQSTPLGDSTAEYLSQFTSLEEIGLWGTPVTDDGVAHLARLPDLHTLGLQKTSLTDGAVAHFKSMKQLRELRIRWTAITPQGVAELRAALPDCQIHY